jgi:hypothetical protein
MPASPPTHAAWSLVLLATAALAGVYRPRRPTASPLYRLLQDHFDRFRGVYEDAYEHTAGRWRKVVDDVVARFLDCGVLEAGFARVRCPDCRAEFLVGFSCRARYFCPSCHAKRLAEWSLWLGEDLLAPVPHRQMVFTVPKRLRPYFLWRRKLLGDLARVAARTATTFVRATLDEPELSVGIVLSIQTHGSLLNWQPHIHALVTDGGFRSDGTFIRMPAHSTEVLTEAFRRGVLEAVRGARALRAGSGGGDAGVDALSLQRP